MGFGDARADDESRFTAAIQRAFRDSSELRLENAPPEALANRYPATKAQAVVLFQELSHESDGRTFFDELEPEIRQRTLTYMTELDIKQESVETLRPWWAYYTLNGPGSISQIIIEFKKMCKKVCKFLPVFTGIGLSRIHPSWRTLCVDFRRRH
jgi:hypothetical protein